MSASRAQCKLKEESKDLPPAEIEAKVNKAKTFRPPFDKYATAAALTIHVANRGYTWFTIHKSAISPNEAILRVSKQFLRLIAAQNNHESTRLKSTLQVALWFGRRSKMSVAQVIKGEA